MTDKPNRFRPIAAPLDVDDASLDRVNTQLGVPTLTKPVANIPVATNILAPSPAEPPRAPLEKLTLEIPDYLADALRRDAAGQRTTARHLVMLALKKDGYRVDDADLVKDGRRTRSKGQ